MIRIAFTGPPSSGKTMLARQVSVILKLVGCWADMVSEVHRSYLVNHDLISSKSNKNIKPYDQFRMFCRQVASEKEYFKVQSDYVLHENPVFQDLIWLDWQNKYKGLDYYLFRGLMSKTLSNPRLQYDIIFLCNPENIPNVRKRVNEQDRLEIYRLTKDFVYKHHPYKIALCELSEGDFFKRVQLTLNVLSAYCPEVKEKLAIYHANHGKTLPI